MSSTFDTAPKSRQQHMGAYRVIKTLGSGTYGKVKLAENTTTGQLVALKIIEKSSIKNAREMVRVRREVTIQYALKHPHITQIYDVMEDSQRIVLVMEYVSGGELFDYIATKKVLTEAEARHVFRQVVSAVHYCHKNGVTHRDLKLENILLDENRNVKLIDFGLSNMFTPDGCLSTFCGSPLYAAPEMIRGVKYVGPEVDCWSLGVLLYTLVCGSMPFDDRDPKNLVRCVSTGTFHIPRRMPSDVRRLVKQMLCPSPAHRADIDAVNEHPWVNDGYRLTPSDESKEKLVALTRAKQTRSCSQSHAKDFSLELQTEAPQQSHRRATHHVHPALRNVAARRVGRVELPPVTVTVTAASPVHNRVAELQQREKSVSTSSSTSSTGSSSCASWSNSSLFQRDHRKLQGTLSNDSGYMDRVSLSSADDCPSPSRRPRGTVSVKTPAPVVEEPAVVATTDSSSKLRKMRRKLTDRVVLSTRKLLGQINKGIRGGHSSSDCSEK
ncbi:NUAK family SNF1-like kinase 1 [Oscarella lobularis]|uniref:NUAK family SNF1-like kinase 1 n=1 Tax=Oscarella lobularis TaxID=121494 RepID=UPI0033140421